MKSAGSPEKHVVSLLLAVESCFCAIAFAVFFNSLRAFEQNIKVYKLPFQL